MVRPTVTPTVLPLRYHIAPQGGFDARFFLYCCSDPQALVHAAVDNSETVHLAWLSPQEALDASDRGEIFLAPPQWYGSYY
jgi:hypothetical protein